MHPHQFIDIARFCDGWDCFFIDIARFSDGWDCFFIDIARFCDAFLRRLHMLCMPRSESALYLGFGCPQVQRFLGK